MSARRYRLVCACGWQVEGDAVEVVDATAEHGRALHNMEATPEEISAHILREMKRQIEEDVARLNTHSTEWFVDRGIITVPAYFELPQIEATRKAGELADFTR